jgi:hypothetical protein
LSNTPTIGFFNFQEIRSKLPTHPTVSKIIKPDQTLGLSHEDNTINTIVKTGINPDKKAVKKAR